MGTWNSRDRETVSGTDFGDRMGVVADSSRNSLSTRSMWRATGADGAGFARRYWLSPNSANAWPLQEADRHRSFLISFNRIPRPMGANKIKEVWYRGIRSRHALCCARPGLMVRRSPA